MKIKVKNLGVLEKAEFSLGDITIICGENNTGKSYATYALFGFLLNWKKVIILDVPQGRVDELLSNGVVCIELQDHLANLEKILLDASRNYTRMLTEIFAASPSHFKETRFSIEVESEKDFFQKGYRTEIGSVGGKYFFQLSNEENNSQLIVTLLTEQDQIDFSSETIQKVIADAARDILFEHFFPNVFIASVERTGTAIFRKELNFARNRLLGELSRTTDGIHTLDLLLNGYNDYSLPIKKM